MSNEEFEHLKRQRKQDSYNRRQRDDFDFFEEIESIDIDDDNDRRARSFTGKTSNVPSNIASLVSKRTLQVTFGIALGVIGIFVCSWLFETLAPIILNENTANKNNKDKVALRVISENQEKEIDPFKTLTSSNAEPKANSHQIVQATPQEQMQQKVPGIAITQTKEIPHETSQSSMNDVQSSVSPTAMEPVTEKTPNTMPKNSKEKLQSLNTAKQSSLKAPTNNLKSDSKGNSSNNQNANHYTIQILGMFDVNKTKTYINSSPIKSNLHYYQTLHENKPWFVIVYGDYESRALAQDALKKLPVAVQQQKPWVRRIGDITAVSHANP